MMNIASLAPNFKAALIRAGWTPPRLSNAELMKLEVIFRRTNNIPPICEECGSAGQCTMNCGPAKGVNYYLGELDGQKHEEIRS